MRLVAIGFAYAGRLNRELWRSIEHCATALRAATVTSILLFLLFRDRFVNFQRVIVKQFLAPLDVAHRIDEYAILFLGGFAVGIAGMVDPARVVPPNQWIDYLTVIQAKIECVWIVLDVGSGFPCGPFTGVFDNARAFGNKLHGVDAATVHTGLAYLDLDCCLSSFLFFRHGGVGEWRGTIKN
jgi:hypothetical protein